MRTGESANAGVVAVDVVSRGRGTRDGVVARLEDDRGGPAWPESIIYMGDALPVAVAVRRRVVEDGGAGVTSKADTDTVKPVVAAGAVSCA